LFVPQKTEKKKKSEKALENGEALFSSCLEAPPTEEPALSPSENRKVSVPKQWKNLKIDSPEREKSR